MFKSRFYKALYFAARYWGKVSYPSGPADDDRTFDVPAEDRMFSIPSEDRMFSIPSEDRMFSIPEATT